MVQLQHTSQHSKQTLKIQFDKFSECNMSNEQPLPRELTSSVPRRGKWTAEEERYTEKIICEYFSCVPINYIANNTITICHLIILSFPFNSVDFENGTLDVPGEKFKSLLH